MRPFTYLAPGTVDEAVTFLGEHAGEATILAGGTDLLVEFRRPSALRRPFVVDISRIAALRGIDAHDGDIVVGPLVTHTELERSPVILAAAPLLAAAAASIGSPQIRNRGTIGGNVMNAATCADTVPALVALGAEATLRSLRGLRRVPLSALFTRPYETTAAPDELLTAIRFPALPAGARSAFLKLGRRNALSIARLSVAAVLRIGDDGRITEGRIVPGAAFPTWQRVAAAEEVLIGETPSERIFAAAGLRASREMVRQTGRRWSTEYKEPVLAVLVRRALGACVPCTTRERGPA